MNQSSSSQFLKLSDPTLCNSRLKMCIHSRVGICLSLAGILPRLAGKDPIVSMVVENLDTQKLTVPLKGSLALEGFLCRLSLLNMYVTIAGQVIHINHCIAKLLPGQKACHQCNQSRCWRVHHVHRDHLERLPGRTWALAGAWAWYTMIDVSPFHRNKLNRWVWVHQPASFQ
jgi:hypothetical protein